MPVENSDTFSKLSFLNPKEEYMDNKYIPEEELSNIFELFEEDVLMQVEIASTISERLSIISKSFNVNSVKVSFDSEKGAISTTSQAKDQFAQKTMTELVQASTTEVHETFNEKHIQYNDPLSDWMFKNKSPIIVKDTDSDSRFKNSFYSGYSFIASPFLYDNNLLGFMLFNNSSTKEDFNHNHMILLSAVCNQVAYKLNDIERKKDEILKQRLEQGKLTV